MASIKAVIGQSKGKADDAKYVSVKKSKKGNAPTMKAVKMGSKKGC